MSDDEQHNQTFEQVSLQHLTRHTPDLHDVRHRRYRFRLRSRAPAAILNPIMILIPPIAGSHPI